MIDIAILFAVTVFVLLGLVALFAALKAIFSAELVLRDEHEHPHGFD